MESSTEILRKLLDERGVEWRDTGKRLNVGNGVRIPIQTEYEQSCGGRWSTVTEALSGTLTVNNLTPEQAIAATLGRGECEIELRESGWGGYTRHCGNCGADLDCDTRNKQNYCPNCGKAVKR